MPKILIIEADPAIRKLLDDILRIEGYGVELMERQDVSTGGIAAAGPDLLLLEMMPGNGAQTVRLIVELRSQGATAAAPIMVSTTDPLLLERYGLELRRLGCSILLKPFNLDELLGLVSREVAAA